MKSIIRPLLLGIALCGANIAHAAGIEIPLIAPFNLFEQGSAVEMRAVVSGASDSDTLQVTVTDYYEQTVLQESIKIDAKEKGKTVVPLNLGKLDRGYYEIVVSLAGQPDVTAQSSLGVVHFVDRTAEEGREGNYRFGLKMGGIRKGFDEIGAMDAAARMGLQWTRQLFTREINEIAEKAPVNIMLKVEGFPEEAYDEERYGPREEFRLRHFNWKKASVPMEKPFKKWIQETVNALPADQNVFEIWNEPWGKYPPADFADIAQWAKDAILEVRPDAVVGPNLGHLNYDSEFIEAGGMKGMNALFLHPYSHAERAEKRMSLRHIREFYEERGFHIDYYVTEYGSPTPPEGPRSHTTEEIQAQRVLRDSFVFYAEDVKAFAPHWLGQNERDPKNKENWYGFYRADGTPKPVLIAFANQALVIDGGEYMGHIFLQSDVGALLAKNKGEYILCLWTNDLDFTVEVPTGVESVTHIDTVGKATQLATPGGKVTMKLDGNPVYLKGVSPDLVKLAQKEPIKDQWVTGLFVRGSRVANKMKKSPDINGVVKADEWNGQTQIPLGSNGVDPKNASGTGYVSWDDEYFYVAASLTDDDPIYNPRKAYSAYDADSIEVWIGTQPKYQVPEFLHTHDVQILFAPTTDTGEPAAGIVNRNTQTLDPIPGMVWAAQKTDKGWDIEIAIPVSSLNEFTAKPGHVMAFEMRYNDGDSTRRADKDGRIKLNPMDGGNPSHHDASVWSFLELKD